MMLAGTSVPLAAPTLVTATARTPGSNETAVTDGAAHLSFCVTATNYYGESVASNVIDRRVQSDTSVFRSDGDVAAGCAAWNIYALLRRLRRSRRLPA